jgi:hypothetical protein
MSEKINNLICELFDIKYEKVIVVKKQQYENAARLRDVERIVESKLYTLIFPNKDYDWSKLKEWLVTYLKENYNIDYSNDIHNLKETIREIKLKQLGIN